MQKLERRGDGLLFSGAVLAAMSTICVFFTSLKNEFVSLDDPGYILNNRFIDTLDWQTVVWAFTSFHESNWHPLTMLSLAIDRQLWGVNPFGFHLTNLLFHSGAVFVICFVFASILRSAGINWPRNWTAEMQIRWASISGALFFGLHPLRVESVAWASERKDVLCLFFISLAILFHLGYCCRHSLKPDKLFTSFGSYWMVFLMVLLALLSKPTAVSLPLVLLVIDWYPLGRFEDRNALLRAVAEKIPFFLMSAGSAVMTVYAQHEPIMLSSELPLISRLLVSFKAVIFYLWKTVWPVGLAPLYPHPGNVFESKPMEYLAYACGVAAICIAAGVMVKRRPAWMALWLYFLVTLAPMLGIIQAGSQWMADRYSYLPSLSVSLLWGAGLTLMIGRLRQGGKRYLANALLGFAACQLIFYCVLTQWHISWWRTSETFETREIEMFPRQVGDAYYARAKYRNEAGRYLEALQDIDEALAFALRRGSKSKYPELAFTQAKILRNLNRLPEAHAAAEWAIQTSSVRPRDEYFELLEELNMAIADIKKP